MGHATQHRSIERCHAPVRADAACGETAKPGEQAHERERKSEQGRPRVGRHRACRTKRLTKRSSRGPTARLDRHPDFPTGRIGSARPDGRCTTGSSQDHQLPSRRRSCPGGDHRSTSRRSPADRPTRTSWSAPPRSSSRTRPTAGRFSGSARSSGGRPTLREPTPAHTPGVPGGCEVVGRHAPCRRPAGLAARLAVSYTPRLVRLPTVDRANRTLSFFRGRFFLQTETSFGNGRPRPVGSHGTRPRVVRSTASPSGPRSTATAGPGPSPAARSLFSRPFRPLPPPRPRPWRRAAGARPARRRRRAYRPRSRP